MTTPGAGPVGELHSRDDSAPRRDARASKLFDKSFLQRDSASRSDLDRALLRPSCDVDSPALRTELHRDVSIISLADYLSLEDEVPFDDLTTAMHAAWNRHALPTRTGAVDAIVHSTGALVIRDWLQRHHGPDRAPIKHLVMLARPTSARRCRTRAGRSSPAAPSASSASARAAPSRPAPGFSRDWSSPVPIPGAWPSATASAWAAPGIDPATCSAPYWSATPATAASARSSTRTARTARCASRPPT